MGKGLQVNVVTVLPFSGEGIHNFEYIARILREAQRKGIRNLIGKVGRKEGRCLAFLEAPSRTNKSYFLMSVLEKIAQAL